MAKQALFGNYLKIRVAFYHLSMSKGPKCTAGLAIMALVIGSGLLAVQQREAWPLAKHITISRAPNILIKNLFFMMQIN